MCVGGKIEEGDRTQQHNENVIPGDVVGAHMTFFDRIVQITEDQNEPEENIELFFRHHFAEQGDEDAVDRKSHTDIAKNHFRDAFPDTDIRLPVVFLHHLLDILRGADIDICRMGKVLVLFGHELISSTVSNCENNSCQTNIRQRTKSRAPFLRGAAASDAGILRWMITWLVLQNPFRQSTSQRRHGRVHW